VAVTRFYLPSSGAAAVSPAFDSAWDVTTSADRIRCVTTKSSTALSAPTRSGAGIDPSNRLARQYVSDPIPAKTVNGTVKGQIKCLEAGSTNDFMPQIVIYVVSNDGSTVRGTLLAADNAALSNEFPITTRANRKFPRGWTGSGTSLSAVAAQENDRIVIELGWRQESTNAAGGQTPLEFGDNAANDLAEDETDTGADNPWIEFSADLFAAAAPAAVVSPRVYGQAVGRAASWCKRTPAGLLVPDLWLPLPARGG
jgi:hypothetical protein